MIERNGMTFAPNANLPEGYLSTSPIAYDKGGFSMKVLDRAGCIFPVSANEEISDLYESANWIILALENPKPITIKRRN